MTNNQERPFIIHEKDAAAAADAAAAKERERRRKRGIAKDWAAGIALVIGGAIVAVLALAAVVWRVLYPYIAAIFLTLGVTNAIGKEPEEWSFWTILVFFAGALMAVTHIGRVFRRPVATATSTELAK